MHDWDMYSKEILCESIIKETIEFLDSDHLEHIPEELSYFFTNVVVHLSIPRRLLKFVRLLVSHNSASGHS